MSASFRFSAKLGCSLTFKFKKLNLHDSQLCKNWAQWLYMNLNLALEPNPICLHGFGSNKKLD